MKTFLYLLVLFVASLTFVACLQCAYESGEEAAKRRYLDATKKVDDCRAAGGERAACESSFGRW
jgi:hypothetical protein